MTYCLINKANGGFSNCLIVLTSKANFFLLDSYPEGCGVYHFPSDVCVALGELMRATHRALLECGAFALHLSAMCQALRAVHFPQTQIFWLIVSQVMPEVLANKSI